MGDHIKEIYAQINAKKAKKCHLKLQAICSLIDFLGDCGR